MLIAFQIILFIILLSSFAGVVGDDDKETRTNMTAITIACILAILVTFIWL